MGLGGFLKKVGKAVGKGLGAVEKVTRPVHGIARSVASGAANAVAPGSGQLVHAFTGGNRGATAGGVMDVLPKLGSITGINVATGRPMSFSIPDLAVAMGKAAAEDAGAMVRAIPELARGAATGGPGGLIKASGDVVKKEAERRWQRDAGAARAREAGMGYQGDSPPVMNRSTPTPQVRYRGAIVGPDTVIRRKYRRMNPLNPRALSRSLRRARAFEKFARRTINLNLGKKFKKKRRR